MSTSACASVSTNNTPEHSSSCACFVLTPGCIWLVSSITARSFYTLRTVPALDVTGTAQLLTPGGSLASIPRRLARYCSCASRPGASPGTTDVLSSLLLPGALSGSINRRGKGGTPSLFVNVGSSNPKLWKLLPRSLVHLFGHRAQALNSANVSPAKGAQLRTFSGSTKCNRIRKPGAVNVVGKKNLPRALSARYLFASALRRLVHSVATSVSPHPPCQPLFSITIHTHSREGQDCGKSNTKLD
jgi:hypothetical protein